MIVSKKYHTYIVWQKKKNSNFHDYIKNLHSFGKKQLSSISRRIEKALNVYHYFWKKNIYGNLIRLH